MKTFLAFLIASIGLLACKKDDSASKATVGQSFDLDTNQTVNLPVSGGNALRVTLKQVNDSRCPTNLQCITAGYATVDVELTDATAIPQVARISFQALNIPNYSRDSVSLTLNQQKYWLRLLDVKPYPTGNSNQTKTATLRLRSY